jgi:amino acid transporter
MTTTPDNRIGLVSAISLGVGGMIGAGIFSILGVVAAFPARRCRCRS